MGYTPIGFFYEALIFSCQQLITQSGKTPHTEYYAAKFMTLNWLTKNYRELTSDQLFEIVCLRQAVFIIEQNCPFPDIDEIDKQALHLCAWDSDKLAAYARIIAPGVSYEQASIGRIVTSAEHRGTGLGRLLTDKAIELTFNKYPEHPIKIGAQQRLEEFYQSFGFETVSQPYEEDGIMHIHMLLENAQS